MVIGLQTQLVLEGQPQSEIDQVFRYCQQVGLPTTLAQVGIDASNDAALMAIAERAVIPGETSHNEPLEVSAIAVMRALKAADQLGRAYL